MSTRKTDNEGLTTVHKGRADHRVMKGTVGARTEPKFDHADVSLWKFAEGQRYTLFMSLEEAYDLADSLDALLEWVEESGYEPPKKDSA